MSTKHSSLADYMVIALSPALIMTLVGSLVFFLIEVFYRGQMVGGQSHLGHNGLVSVDRTHRARPRGDSAGRAGAGRARRS